MPEAGPFKASMFEKSKTQHSWEDPVSSPEA